MEELKLLIEMVSTLPTMAIWVLVGFLLTKSSALAQFMELYDLELQSYMM